MKELESFAENGTEFRVNLTILKMRDSNEVMFITVTSYNAFTMKDYTVVFNGMPRVKELKKICGKNYKAVELIIDTLKVNAVNEACDLWGFYDEEWKNGLDNVLEEYMNVV